MKNLLRVLCLSLTAPVLALMAQVASASAAVTGNATTAASPAAAGTTPAATPAAAPKTGKIKVLIVDGYTNHDWKKTTELVKDILASTDYFEVTESTAPKNEAAPGWGEWHPQFKDYDVVLQMCNDLGGAGQLWPEDVQKAFVDYVRDGGSVYIYHSGQNAFAKWDAYNEIIGLGWRPASYGTAIAVNEDETLKRYAPGEGRATGHGPRGEAVIHERGEHPIHAGMPKAWKTGGLEVYYFARGPAENVEVLSYAKDARYGEMWPVEWTVQYGKGKAYISTFGHVWSDYKPDDPALRCVGVQTNIIRALQWLANRPVTYPIPKDFPTADALSLRSAPGAPAAEAAAPVAK